MTLPGFTAEASLYRTSERYPQSPVAVANAGGTVTPQYCYSPHPGVVCCWTPWFGLTCRRIYRPQLPG